LYFKLDFIFQVCDKNQIEIDDLSDLPCLRSLTKPITYPPKSSVCHHNFVSKMVVDIKQPSTSGGYMRLSDKEVEEKSCESSGIVSGLSITQNKPDETNLASESQNGTVRNRSITRSRTRQTISLSVSSPRTRKSVRSQRVSRTDSSSRRPAARMVRPESAVPVSKHRQVSKCFILYLLSLLVGFGC
jgi:hypothetical protein